MVQKLVAICLVLAGLGLVATGFSVGASAATGSANVTFTILSHQTLTISGDFTGNPPAIEFGDVRPEQPTTAKNVTVQVKSNIAYNLNYTAGSAGHPGYFSDGVANTVPVGRLTYNDGSGPVAFATSGSLASNVPRTTGQGHSYSYAYVLTVLFDDEVASYNGSITYEVTPTVP